MATLQIKNFPDDLHAALAERAKAERTTMSEYATRTLQRDVETRSMREWLAEVRRVVPVGDPAAPGFDMTAVMADVRADGDFTTDATDSAAR